MSPPMAAGPKLLDLTHGKQASHDPGSAPCAANAAVSKLAHGSVSDSDVGYAPTPDPFLLYRAFLATDMPYEGTTEQSRHHDSSTNTGNPIDAQCFANQQRCRPRAAPYNLAIRLANRSNGVPLATIVERGSVSTLDSHGSPQNVGRLPSIPAVENVSPASVSHRATKSLDEKCLRDIQEEARQEHIAGVESEPKPSRLGDLFVHMFPVERAGVHSPGHCAAPIPSKETLHEANVPMTRRLPLTDDSCGNNSIRGFFRGVLWNVRGAARSRSRSSSMSTPPGPHNKREQTNATARIVAEENTPIGKCVQEQVQCDSGPAAGPSPKILTAECAQTQSQDAKREGLHGGQAPLACAYPPTPSLPDSHFVLQQDEDWASSDLLQIHPRQTRSVRALSPEQGEEVLQHRLSTPALDLTCSGDNFATCCAVKTVSDPLANAPSLRDYEYGKDTSRNPSFCSTVSTSYSGTVLGVDVDLQQEIFNQVKRPVSPVWFTPRESDIGTIRQPKSKQEQPKDAPRPTSRSITSSALSALLPIAAAEGIVRPHLTTPQLSFFSPSGNLIQTEGSSPLSSNTSYSSAHSKSAEPGTTEDTASHHASSVPSWSAYAALTACTRIPSTRPAPVPLTTPPQSSAPLPNHLRHHHNYRHAEKSRINSDSSSNSAMTIKPGPTVKGCGGVIRTNSLTPHSGIQRSPPSSQSKSHYKNGTRYGRPTVREKARKATQSQFTFLSPWHVSAKGNTLKKPPPTSYNESRIGPTAGHALRLCFCQPYDGAEVSYAEVGCTGEGAGRRRGAANAADGAGEESMPNARIITGRNDKWDGSNEKNRKRSDSWVSVAIRVGVAGA